MRISSKKILLIFAAIMFIVVFGRFFTLLVFPDSQTTLQKGDLFQIKSETSLTQMFMANRNDLTKIEFLMRTPGPTSKDIVQIEIADETCSDIIHQGKLQKSFLGSENLYEFKFDPILDSEGKTYCLKIKSEKKKFKFFTMDSNDSRLELQDIPGRSLAIRTVYNNESIGQDLSELNQRISQYKPWFLKHFYLYAIVILFTLLSVTIVVILILT